jgi:hypothetical protein
MAARELKSSMTHFIMGIAKSINQKYNKLPDKQTLSIPIYSLNSPSDFHLTKKQIIETYKEGVAAGRFYVLHNT